MNYDEEHKKALDFTVRWDETILRTRYAILIEKYQALEKRVQELEWLECETVRGSLAGDEEVGG